MDAGTLDAEKIAAYAEQNCATASLAECAARFCCHPNSITRLLKRDLGVSFNELVVAARARKARELLAQGDLTVQEVASVCGYANMTRFYRVFEAAWGCTPGEYRRQALYGGT